MPELLITIESDKKKGKVAGYYPSQTYWKHGNKSIAQINICAEHLRNTWLEISETVLHEAVHLYCFLHGVPSKTIIIISPSKNLLNHLGRLFKKPKTVGQEQPSMIQPKKNSTNSLKTIISLPNLRFIVKFHHRNQLAQIVDQKLCTSSALDAMLF